MTAAENSGGVTAAELIPVTIDIFATPARQRLAEFLDATGDLRVKRIVLGLADEHAAENIELYARPPEQYWGPK